MRVRTLARGVSEVIFLPARDSEGKTECSASWIHSLEEEGALTAPVPGVQTRAQGPNPARLLNRWLLLHYNGRDEQL